MTHSIFDDRIAGLAFMLDFPDDLCRRIIGLFHEVGKYKQIPQGAVLFAEHDAGTDAGYVLLTGTVRVQRDDGFRRKVLPPALLGEMRQFQLAGKEERSATVTALEDLEMFRFEWEAFYTALAQCANDTEQETVREAIKRTAWMHYLEQEGDI